MRTLLNFVILFIVIAFLVLPLFAQDNSLPEYGDITDIKDLQKVYLIADSTDARNLILKEIKKYAALTVVNSPSEAEFFLEYKVLRQVNGSSGLNIPVTTSEMTAYTSKDKSRRIAWSKTEEEDAILSRPNEVNLTRSFIKALKKIRNGKKSEKQSESNNSTMKEAVKYGARLVYHGPVLAGYGLEDRLMANPSGK